MIKIAKCFVAIAVMSLCANSAFSQWNDGNGNLVLSPNSGAVLNPSFLYDPADGVFYVENVGPNGVVDSTDNLTQAGDDIGLISLLVSAPAGVTVEPTLPVFDNGIAWAAPVVFNGQIQLGGTAVLGNFLPISDEPTAVFQLNTGLGVDDFRNSDGNVTIELGVNFASGMPGATLFSVGDAAMTGAFRVVLEPGAFGMIMLAGISLLGFRRR